MANKLIQKPLIAAIGAAVITSLSAMPVANADSNPFAANQLSSGYMVADMEGKCGGSKSKEEGKCGGDKKASEGKCGGDKKVEKEGKCGSDKKSKEGKCGGSM